MHSKFGVVRECAIHIFRRPYVLRGIFENLFYYMKGYIFYYNDKLYNITSGIQGCRGKHSELSGVQIKRFI